MNEQTLETTLGTVHALLLADGMDEAAMVVRSFPARAQQTGYDNWNGGTELWDVYLELPPEHYARMGPQRSRIEEQVSERLKRVLETETQDLYAVKIIPALVKNKDWREATRGVARQVRVNIFDGLRLEKVKWFGSLHEVEFLSRLFDLQKMPSNDPRYTDAARDIWQHCINNDDWELDWVYSDERFDLLSGPSERFLRFLCETVHPVVRPDRDEAMKLASQFNDQLRGEGWEIYEEERIAGHPRFAYRLLTNHGVRAVSRARTVADALDAGWMAKEIERLENAVDRDPALAIGTAKDLVESCCKTILSKLSVECAKSDDLGDLTKKVAKELKLVPKDISDGAKGAENIRRVLQNLAQLTHNLAELRGLYGSGHGRDGKHKGLQPRHARLAVASAVAFIDFISETYRERAATGSSDATAESK